MGSFLSVKEMKNTYAIDYETFYTAHISVKTMGIEEYVRHPQVEAYLVSVYGEDYQFVGKPSEVDWAKIAGKHWLSHNAFFDQWVHKLAVEKREIPDTAPELWDDTADMCAYLSCERNLKEAVHVFLGEERDKSVRDDVMKGKHWEDFTADEQLEIKKYAMLDAKNCYDLWVKLSGQWPAEEQRLSRINRKSGFFGIPLNRQLVLDSHKFLAQRKFDIQVKIPWLEKGFPALSPSQIATACCEAGIPAPARLAEDSPEFEEWYEKYGKNYGWGRVLMDYRRCNKWLCLVDRFKDRMQPNNRIAATLKYYGADSTGRYSGEARLNLQNFPKHPYPDPEDFPGDLPRIDIRSFIKAPPGKKLIVADYSQIEPRVLAWLTSDQAFLDHVRSGMAVYEVHARQTMGWTGGPLKKENPKLYALAKARVLGLGYGCGAQKFKVVAKTMAGLDITTAEAASAVYDFRMSNQKTVNLWNYLDKEFKRHISLNMAWKRNDPFLLGLPSGRSLSYFNPHFSEGEVRAERLRDGKKPTHIYGGKLTENLVQATARDVLANTILNLDSAGYNLLFHVHDEVIIEADENVDPTEVKEIMCREPDWIKGLPLDVDLIETDHYKK